MEPATVTRASSGGLDVVTLSRTCWNMHYVTAYAGEKDNLDIAFQKLGCFAQKKGARIIEQNIFSPCEFHDSGMHALERACGDVEWPVRWLARSGATEKTPMSTQARAVSGVSLDPIRADERIVGYVFEDDDARYCFSGDLRPADLSLSREQQARATFEQMEAALQLAGMDFCHVVRVWLYIDRILEWYDAFNKVRSDFFREREVFDGLVPASTGIGLGSPTGAAVVSQVFALKPKTDNVHIQVVPSTLQCPALDYESSFSRAVEVALPDHRRLYVSGTASIDTEGKTAHVGDVENQIRLTMEVVLGILESRGAGWDDVCQAEAYFKRPADVAVFKRYCRDHRLPALPVITTHANVCREELLFEVEMAAILAGTRG